MTNRFIVLNADITQLDVDAIVNAADNALLGGGGVDGAIHDAAGPDLMKECSKLNGCETGDAKITNGYLLPAKYVIHTVGPVWTGGNNFEPELLKRCYDRALDLAIDHRCMTIAFSSISTGTYRYPIELAAKVAIDTVITRLSQHTDIVKVIFCCFSENDVDVYKRTLDRKKNDILNAAS